MTTVYDSFPTHDLKPGMLDAPAFHRNIDAIMGVLNVELSKAVKHITEIGSGTGQHAVTIASVFDNATYLPSDINEEYRRSIAAWMTHAGLSNVLEPVSIDLIRGAETVASTDALLCFNVIHIAPKRVIAGLADYAANAINEDGKLLLYGPYKLEGKHTSPSNDQFDQSLKLKNPEWGVRDLEAVDEAMAAKGLSRIALHTMPANNFMPVYRKS